jgi:hypothetical protein
MLLRSATGAVCGTVLLRGGRLARDRGLVDAQVFGLEQAQVGGHARARFQQHHISWNQIRCIHLGALPITQHDGAAGQHDAHRVEGLFCLTLLREANDRIDQHDAQDDCSIHIVAQRQSDQPCGEQRINQGIVKLDGKARQRAAPQCARQAVGAMLAQAAAGLNCGKATLRIAAQRGHRSGGFAGVPVSVFRRGHGKPADGLGAARVAVHVTGSHDTAHTSANRLSHLLTATV